MLEENFLFEDTGILGFDVCQRGRDCALVSLEVVVAHFKFPELYLESLGLLPYCIQFALQGGCRRVMGCLEGHELGLGVAKHALPGIKRQKTDLPFVPLGFDARDLYLEVLLSLLGAFDLLDELLLEFLARGVEFIELSPSFGEHVCDLVVLCFPICGGSIAREGVSWTGGGGEADILELVVVKRRHCWVSAEGIYGGEDGRHRPVQCSTESTDEQG